MSYATARFVAALVAALVLFPRCEFSDGDQMTTPAATTLPESQAQPSPQVTVVGGTSEQRNRMNEATQRFISSGLHLPPLTVELGSGPAECNGHHGVFRSRTMTISICSTVESVYEHELAHAWERTNLTDGLRTAFMALRGYDVWSDPEVPWNERGVEGAAFVIQQGMATLPLPPALGDEFTSRMQAFELLTGVPAPRLAAWMADRSVRCDERPTPLSHQLPDADGLACNST